MGGACVKDKLGLGDLAFSARPERYPARGGAISAAVAQQLYTLLVGGSNPSSPTIHYLAVNMDIKNLGDVPPFITKDGSEIRELLAHRNSVIRQQSLAEARLAPGASTQEHYHVQTEEIYYITAGFGRIRIDREMRDVEPGDAIAIPAGKKHKLWNTGSETLRLLCCCAPAYEHSDTIITEESV